MSLPPPPPATEPRAATPHRPFWTWWRGLSPSRQDRVATLAPLLSVLLFLAAIVSAFWYLRNEEIEREVESVKRDADLVHQQIRLRLIENQEQLVRISREIGTHVIDPIQLTVQAESLVRTRPEIVGLSWLGPNRAPVARYVPPDLLSTQPGLVPRNQGSDPRVEELRAAFGDARDLRAPVYSKPVRLDRNLVTFQVHVPIIDQGEFVGVLVAEYSTESLLRYLVPAEVTRRRVISLVEESGSVLASTVPSAGDHPPNAVVYTTPFSPVGHGVLLRGEGYRTSVGLIGNTLFWMVAALSLLTLWMLLGTWRHMRRRLQIQDALVQETNFRRAMENSMLTGMRTMDMDGRITYVNPAFCAMTGFAETELIGRLPPFPHWPHNRIEENTRILRQELEGRSPAGGIEVKVMRKDGSEFDSRMYVSPLIDARGQQTGWMTSMTNITEAKRIRDQLTAAHERFTTVLEGLDAAVSVVPAGPTSTSELLFANRTYRQWFGSDTALHQQLHPAPSGDEDEPAGAPVPAQRHEGDAHGIESREIYVAALEKWFEVRSRYLQWTDGRLAQMLITTDITARRRVEEMAAQQAERAQSTSRLITMGEMASSVAHELNQPLAAITNYCNGMVSRLRSGNLSEEDMIGALEKTAKQAHRAGQIIHRIRAFVKRSEPQRQPTTAASIVEDTLELAGIEVRRRNVTLLNYVAQRLPELMVDPILIEQVLLNLIKNAAEAIDNAQLPPSRRKIELRVVPKFDAELGGAIEFSVRDSGPGMPEDVLRRIYEAFFSTKTDGMGIGLSLCRSIIESHQGRIRAENLYNQGVVVGCCFTFLLPVSHLGESTKPIELT